MLKPRVPGLLLFLTSMMKEGQNRTQARNEPPNPSVKGTGLRPAPYVER
jgi:hypothetical protein